MHDTFAFTAPYEVTVVQVPPCEATGTMTKFRPGSRYRSLRNISTKPPIFFEAEGLTYCLYYARTGKCHNIRDWNIRVTGYRVRPGIVRLFTTSRAAPLTIPIFNLWLEVCTKIGCAAKQCDLSNPGCTSFQILYPKGTVFSLFGA